MEITREEHTIDAAGQSLGRLASDIALKLRGKNKPSYQPHIDGGDIVRVINVAQIQLTGKKADQREYHSYTGYPGGIKSITMGKLLGTNPEKLLKNAVRNMLPDTKLRSGMMKRLIIE